MIRSLCPSYTRIFGNTPHTGHGGTKVNLPLANRVQKFFVNAGYKINALARWSIFQINEGFRRPGKTITQQIRTAIKVALVTPVVLASFLVSTPCYLAASYAGGGRFDFIEGRGTSDDVPPHRINVMFQNICGQNPWSVFTSGYPPPLQPDANGKRRVDAILAEIEQTNPDVYCGQEFDDLATSKMIAETLAKRGFTSVRDLGCDHPFLNHSGMFAAVGPRVRDHVEIRFTPIDKKHTSGITSWCNRGILTINLPSVLKVINIHLNSGEKPEDHRSRLEQLQRYVIPQIQGDQPTIVVGDSNLDTGALSQEEKESTGLSPLVNALEGQVTCSDRLKHENYGKPSEGCSDCAEKIDVILFNPHHTSLSRVNLHPIPNSDHFPVSFTVGAVT